MNYSDLRESIAEWLVRPDLADVIPAFIESAEARLNRDPRVRSTTMRTNFVIDGDGLDLHSDFRAIDSWYLDGPTFYGPLYIVDGNALSEVKAKLGTVPAYVAIMGRKAYFAPEPQGEYTSRLTYLRRIPALSDVEPTNWMLDENPDIYRLAALSEAAPYLKEDERLATWEGLLNSRLEDLNIAASQEAYSGSLVRLFRPFG